jgi:hypothetical protein
MLATRLGTKYVETQILRKELESLKIDKMQLSERLAGL